MRNIRLEAILKQEVTNCKKKELHAVTFLWIMAKLLAHRDRQQELMRSANQISPTPVVTSLTA